MVVTDAGKKEASKIGLIDRISSGFDRIVEVVAPVRAARRMEARMNMAVAGEFFSSAGGYDGANPRAMGGPAAFPSDADSAMIGLDEIRSNSRDAVRNQPIAGAVVNTTDLNVLGTGLTLHSRIDREVLNLSDDDADAFQRHVERRWKLWAGSKSCDLERKLTFHGHCHLALRSRIVNGESLTLLPVKPLDGLSNPLRLQAIESDRLCNPLGTITNKRLVNGIEKDEDGAAQRYWIMRSHPGNFLYINPDFYKWDPYEAFNPYTGLPNVVHWFRTERAGQTRGLPMLGPILEPLKDLSRMTKAELKRAVVSAMFTVFIKSNSNQTAMANMPGSPYATQHGPMGVAYGAKDRSAATTGNIKLGYGAVVGLGRDQEIQLADPKLPNANFDPFWQGILRQVGMQIGIPFEVLIKHYSSSYSASRAAMEDAWSFFEFMLFEMTENHCDPIFAVWFAGEVAQKTIHAPGFFSDLMIRAAWLGHEWIGPTKPILDPVKEITAAERRMAMGITTAEEETAAYSNTSWAAKQPTRVREREMRNECGLPIPGVSGREMIQDQTEKPAPGAADGVEE